MYESMVELYKVNPNNNAVIKYMADKAEKDILDLQKAINVLEKEKTV